MTRPLCCLQLLGKGRQCPFVRQDGIRNSVINSRMTCVTASIERGTDVTASDRQSTAMTR